MAFIFCVRTLYRVCASPCVFHSLGYLVSVSCYLAVAAFHFHAQIFNLLQSKKKSVLLGKVTLSLHASSFTISKSI